MSSTTRSPDGGDENGVWGGRGGERRRELHAEVRSPRGETGGLRGHRGDLRGGRPRLQKIVLGVDLDSKTVTDRKYRM
jgi:hypothetical protein